MRKYRYIFIILMIGLCFSSGCLDEESISPLVPPPSANLSADILSYVDMQGFFRSNSGTPKLIDAFSIYLQASKYHLIDIRSAEKYAQGHISGAVNIQHEQLIDYLENFQNEPHKIIVLIDENGSCASFVNCLCGIYGFTSLYVLKFGMPSWNRLFAEDWMNNLFTYSSGDEYALDGISYLPDESNGLPNITQNDNQTIEENVKNRIRELLDMPLSVSNDLTNPSTIFFHFNDLYHYYNPSIKQFENINIACYGDKEDYYPYSTKFPELPSHPINTTWVQPPMQIEYRANSSLQYFQNNKVAALYCIDGHKSAFATALLRLAGYDAKSMLYGINSFAYQEIPLNNKFTPATIIDLPYVTGN